MAFDFPTSPTIGQLYPATVAAGLPQYIWDGNTWIAVGSPNNYVRISGSTMTGALVLNADPTVPLGAATKQYIDSRIPDISGKINRSGDSMNGTLVLHADPTAAMAATTKQYTDSRDAGKVNKSGDTMTGSLIVNGEITANLSANQGVYRFGNNAAYLFYNAGTFAFSGGAVQINGNASATGSFTAPYGIFTNGAPAVVGAQANPTGVSMYWDTTYGPTILALSGGQYANLYMYAVSTVISGHLYVAGASGNNRWQADGLFVIANQGYKPGGGSWAATSDERIKTVLGDYEQGLAAIKQLNPVRYRYKGNVITDRPDQEVKAEGLKSPAEPLPDHQAVLGREYIGLVAQHAEASMPEMVTRTSGKIDGQQVDDLRNLDSSPLIFALVNAVKELSARLEALERPNG